MGSLSGLAFNMARTGYHSVSRDIESPYDRALVALTTDDMAKELSALSAGLASNGFDKKSKTASNLLSRLEKSRSESVELQTIVIQDTHVVLKQAVDQNFRKEANSNIIMGIFFSLVTMVFLIWALVFVAEGYVPWRWHWGNFKRLFVRDRTPSAQSDA